MISSGAFNTGSGVNANRLLVAVQPVAELLQGFPNLLCRCASPDPKTIRVLKKSAWDNRSLKLFT